MDYQRATQSAQKEQPKTLLTSLHQTSLNHVTVHPLLELQHTIGNQAVLNLLHSRNIPGDASTQASIEPHADHDLSRLSTPVPFTKVIQTKLTVSQPEDEYEQEADRISQQVMRMPEPQLPRACACGGACPECQAEQPDHERLQMKHVPASSTEHSVAPPIVHEVLRSPGQPLDAANRSFMEPRFGHDFSHIQVHTDEWAAASARAVHALAYASGNHLVFGAGQYAPTTASGRHLLAHELAHTIQQSSLGSGVALQRTPTGVPNKPMEPLEVVAQRIARLALGPQQAAGGFFRSKVLTVVRNKLSGEIFVGLNTGIPKKLTDVIDKAIKAQKASISSGEVTIMHDIDPGTHSEVNALNRAIAAQERLLGRSMTEEELGDTFELHNVWLSGKARRFTTAPRCEHCTRITRGVSVTESVSIAEGKITGPQGGTGGAGQGGGGESDGKVSSELTTRPIKTADPTDPNSKVAPESEPPTAETRKTEPTAHEGMPDLEPIYVGGPSAKGEAIGGAVVIGAQFKDWIMGKLVDKVQSERVNIAWERKFKYIQLVQQDHPELGALVTIYWRMYRGSEGEASRRFEDISVKTGMTEKEAREAPEPSLLNLSASSSDMETDERWIPPLKPLSLAEYPTPYRKIAVATFAPGRAVLRDVSWGGPRGGAFNKKGTTMLDVPKGVHPKFAILMPPASIYVQGYGTVDIQTGPETTSDGYQVPLISDLHAALVFPLDGETATLLSNGPGIRDTTFQLRGDFDLTRWVPIEDVQIENVLSGEVAPPPPTAEQELYISYTRFVAMHPQQAAPSFASSRGLQGPNVVRDVLRFSRTGEEVTGDRLIAWARQSHPRGLDDPTLLKDLYSSHEFNGSDDAYERAAVMLVLKLREEKLKARTAE